MRMGEYYNIRNSRVVTSLQLCFMRVCYNIGSRSDENVLVGRRRQVLHESRKGVTLNEQRSDPRLFLRK